MNSQVKLVARNLIALGLVAFPLFFLAVWARALIVGTPYAQNLAYVVGNGIFYYLAYLLPLLAGGMIHQLVLLSYVKKGGGTRRAFAILMSPVVLLAISAAGQPLNQLRPFTIPIVLSLLVYSLLIQLPSKRKPSASTG
jgi:hypothetical protein